MPTNDPYELPERDNSKLGAYTGATTLPLSPQRYLQCHECGQTICQYGGDTEYVAATRHKGQVKRETGLGGRETIRREWDINGEGGDPTHDVNFHVACWEQKVATMVRNSLSKDQL